MYPHKVPWVTLLQHLLSSLGFYGVWLAQGVSNVNASVRVFEQRLRDNNVQNWNSRVENSSRSTFLKSIVTFNSQFYLKYNLGINLTAVLSRLLLSSHSLSIETGRWRRPHCIPREDRKCTTCNTIEDEYLTSLSNALYLLTSENDIFLNITGPNLACIN